MAIQKASALEPTVKKRAASWASAFMRKEISCDFSYLGGLAGPSLAAFKKCISKFGVEDVVDVFLARAHGEYYGGRVTEISMKRIAEFYNNQVAKELNRKAILGFLFGGLKTTSKVPDVELKKQIVQRTKDMLFDLTGTRSKPLKSQGILSHSMNLKNGWLLKTEFDFGAFPSTVACEHWLCPPNGHAIFSMFSPATLVGIGRARWRYDDEASMLKCINDMKYSVHLMQDAVEAWIGDSNGK